ncbi:uracil phosphoribosyltransferase [Micrococcoides hystricis]|uniref:Uracil phosphoribosyltransferase n=1 Tax=Micrococcoides hystricis TaxID=1572761 RepID=A0ABV6PAV8_9MICC
MRIHQVDHPLIAHKLTQLRDENTTATGFRQLTNEIVQLLAYPATAKLPTAPKSVTTPVCETVGSELSGETPLIVPILRAGLGMLEGMSKFLPEAEVGFLGMVRDEQTLEIETYAERLPADLTGRHVFILDPMLATGNTMVAALHYLREAGAASLSCICIVAAPEGIAQLEEHAADLDVDLYIASLDEGLTETAYISPGLGDAGDRLFGTSS